MWQRHLTYQGRSYSIDEGVEVREGDQADPYRIWTDRAYGRACVIVFAGNTTIFAVMPVFPARNAATPDEYGSQARLRYYYRRCDDSYSLVLRSIQAAPVSRRQMKAVVLTPRYFGELAAGIAEQARDKFFTWNISMRWVPLGSTDPAPEGVPFVAPVILAYSEGPRKEVWVNDRLMVEYPH